MLERTSDDSLRGPPPRHGLEPRDLRGARPLPRIEVPEASTYCTNTIRLLATNVPAMSRQK
jgi:hypothetical protein